jgi:hypothetical protein
MNRLIVICTIAAALHPKPPTAGELFSTAEVAKFLAAPAVQIDSINSGKNELTGVDFCSYFVTEKDPRGVMLKLRRGASADDAMLSMISARAEDEFVERKPEVLAGIGDEAQYLDYSDGRGGTIIVRSGPNVVTFTGTISKATGIAIARLAVPRLAS